jgi:ornithine cyclodeaminase/alanine dehydrogenase-like protein (mu-crystallin family)
VRYLDAAAVAALGPAAAVDAIRDALLAGLDPAADPPRVPVDLDTGQFLLMPSQAAAPDSPGTGAAGVKVVTVAPANPARGLPRIQAVYLLFDHETLTLRAILDGTALTTLRTPAVSVAAVLGHLPDRPLRLVVIGAGPQAAAHAETMAAVHRIERTTYLVREPGRAPVGALALGAPVAKEALHGADVVVCATSARTPVLDSALLRDDVVVVAVGSHEPDARELEAGLLARSTVVVEDRTTALREAGDVVMAIAEGALTAKDLVLLRDLVAGTAVTPAGRPLVFKSVGMPWQDLVVARAVVDRHD